MEVNTKKIEVNYSYEHVPTIKAFSNCDRRIRGLMGPFSSGKSSGCLWEIIRRSMAQKPGRDGIRRTRWAIVRNSYPQLRDTTIKTVLDWFPPIVFGQYKIASHEYLIKGFKGMEIELLFRALDKPEHVSNLLSLEITGAWINEAREVPKAIIEAIDSRIGRFPSVRDGGCTWKGIIMDTNPPDEDSWWYHLFEVDRPENAAIFKQPSGLSPQAENICPQGKVCDDYPEGRKPGNECDYYTGLAVGKSQAYVDVYIHGKYGFIKEGKPVFERCFNDNYHVASHPIIPIRNTELILGFDFGLTPACIIAQITPRGFLNILMELESDGMGIQRFVRNMVKPALNTKFPGYPIVVTGDPAGLQRGQRDEKTCFEALKEEGFKVSPAQSNDLVARIGSVEDFLSRLTDGQPTFQLDPSCKTLRKGFNKGYHFRKIAGTEDRYSIEPTKNQYSHCLTGETNISTPFGSKPIKDIKVGDYVDTPLGPKKVTATMNSIRDNLVETKISNGKKIKSTHDHPFYLAQKGLANADALQYNDVLIGINTKEAKQWAEKQNIQSRNSTESAFTGNHLDIIWRTLENMVLSICTDMSGSITTAQYQTSTMCTISMATGATTELKISDFGARENISHIIPKNYMPKIQNVLSRALQPHGRQPRNGIALKPGADGTESMAKEHGSAGSPKSTHAAIAEKNTRFSGEQKSGGFVRPTAKLRRGAFLALTMLSANALSAARSFLSTSIPKSRLAPEVVGQKRVQGQEKVYDLTVEGAHCFYAEGVLVGNCHDALQYLCLYILGRIKKIEKRRKHGTISRPRVSTPGGY